MSNPAPEISSFRDLKLSDALMKSLDEVGYETPTPVQAQTIPLLMEGRDLLGHAPTGTGKTAAFALPLISRIDLKKNQVQVLVLAPTRELAIQVAEAFQRYAKHMKDFHVLPIYGGQEYSGQIRQLKRGVHVIVGTPGRVMDHMRKGTLKLDALQALVLDEADEMLRMGFIDDVEWVLEQSPKDRQIALFSATMPKEVKRIAGRHLNNPETISIKAKTATAETIRQRYWKVSGMHKLDALTRILEVETFDAMLVFVRTKIATTELAERLTARGYAAEALNGDMPQKQRETMVDRLKKGKLDILVATDVAARGLDVDRVSHVLNYDIPHDTEAYIHRIGRTGRAGRQGDAILFVAPREQRMLAAIEQATRQKIERLDLPSTEMVNNKRIADFKQRITDTIAQGDHSFMRDIMEQYQQEHDIPAIEIATAMAQMSLGDRPLLMEPEKKISRGDSGSQRDRGDRSERRSRDRPERGDRDSRPGYKRKPGPPVPADKERYRVDVGHEHGVKPGNIVGAIANEAGIDGKSIGHIDIHDTHSLVDLPRGISRETLEELKKAFVCGRKLNLSRSQDGIKPGGSSKPSRADRKKPGSSYAKTKPKAGGPKKEKKEKKNKKPKDKGKPKKAKKAADSAESAA